MFGDGDHRTLEVVPAAAGFKGGPYLVCFLCGPDNNHDYRPFAHVDQRGSPRLWARYRDDSRLADALRALAADPAAAAEAYVAESRRCARCRRPLTRPSSIDRGVGDRCAGEEQPAFAKAAVRVRLASSLRLLQARRQRR